MKRFAMLSAALLGLTYTTAPLAQGAGGGDAKERAAALKQSLAQGQQALRSYQWVETTTVSLKGEQKSMKQAVDLVKTYVPPNPALIQRAIDAGKVSIEAVQPGKVGRLVVKDYELPGDFLAITIDLATNRLLGISVATYLGTPSKPVTLNATMASLPDGATYTASTQLSLPSEKVVVDVANAGYRKM